MPQFYPQPRALQSPNSESGPCKLQGGETESADAASLLTYVIFGNDCDFLFQSGLLGLFLCFPHQLLDEAPRNDREEGRRRGRRGAAVLLPDLFRQGSLWLLKCNHILGAPSHGSGRTLQEKRPLCSSFPTRSLKKNRGDASETQNSMQRWNGRAHAQRSNSSCRQVSGSMGGTRGGFASPFAHTAHLFSLIAVTGQTGSQDF